MLAKMGRAGLPTPPSLFAKAKWLQLANAAAIYIYIYYIVVFVEVIFFHFRNKPWWWRGGMREAKKYRIRENDTSASHLYLHFFST